MTSYYAKSLWLEAPGTLLFREETLPPPGIEEVIVKTYLGSISEGTERSLYLGTMDESKQYFPRITGYENIGIVERLGPTKGGASPLHVGDLVVGWYGHRSRVLVSTEKVIPIPKSLTNTSVALLTVLFADTAQAIQRAVLQQTERVVVLGAGALGLLCIEHLKACGIREIDVVDSISRRRELALKFGACNTVPLINDLQLCNYTVSVDCSGSPQLFNSIASYMRPLGKIILLSDPCVHQTYSLQVEFFERELMVFSSSDCRNYQTIGKSFLSGLDDNQTHRLSNILDRRISFEDLPHFFSEIARQKSEDHVKAIVEY